MKQVTINKKNKTLVTHTSLEVPDTDTHKKTVMTLRIAEGPGISTTHMYISSKQIIILVL